MQDKRKRGLLAGLLTGIFGALAVPSVGVAAGDEAGNMRLSAETVAARGPVWTNIPYWHWHHERRYFFYAWKRCRLCKQSCRLF